MNGASKKKGKRGKIATRCKSHQDTGAEVESENEEEHVRNGKCWRNEKLTSEQKTCAHTVVVWKASVVMMMENNFTHKGRSKKKPRESSENPSSHSRIITALFTTAVLRSSVGNGTRLCFFMGAKRLYRAYIRSLGCKKTKNVYLHKR